MAGAHHGSLGVPRTSAPRSRHCASEQQMPVTGAVLSTATTEYKETNIFQSKTWEMEQFLKTQHKARERRALRPEAGLSSLVGSTFLQEEGLTGREGDRNTKAEGQRRGGH